jgi:D-serine deaminase-like pyridoxal phosphate-dependent protein
MNLADLDALDTPALAVDVATMERNLSRMSGDLARAGVAVRPHWKTSKCLEMARRQLALGAVGFTCSTPGEVRALGEAGIRGLLWAHLPVGAPKVAFAVEAVGRYGTTLIADSVEAAQPVGEALVAAGLVADVFLEVDTGLGRTGVDPDAAVRVAAQIAALPGLRLRGVMTHEGHLYHYARDHEGLDAAAVASAESLVGVAETLRGEGHEIDVVSVGSTPGLAVGPYVSGVTEARPGTYVFNDGNQIRLGTCTLDDCALTVVARVVSTQRSGTVIIDAGSKAMSSDAVTAETGYGMVLGVDGTPLLGVSFPRANEEHGFLVGPGTASLAVGDLVRILPHHACATVNMWSELIAMQPDGSYERWPIVARH